MTTDELAQEETRLNHAAENARSFYMRWAIVPANVCMQPMSIVRYFFAMLMRVALTVVALMLIVSALVITDIMSSHHIHTFSFLSNPRFMKMALKLTVTVFRLIGPMFAFFALTFSAVLTIPFVKYMRYWNRRARRLQANPIIPNAPVSNPGTWPPPPRME